MDNIHIHPDILVFLKLDNIQDMDMDNTAAVRIKKIVGIQVAENTEYLINIFLGGQRIPQERTACKF